jgi:hypothetical protein
MQDAKGTAPSGKPRHFETAETKLSLPFLTDGDTMNLPAEGQVFGY